MTSKTKTTPWERKPPAGTPKKKLSPAQKRAARARAKRAGRHYPNLVDNMAVAAGALGKRKRAK